jgi:hypothetical protein
MDFKNGAKKKIIYERRLSITVISTACGDKVENWLSTALSLPRRWRDSSACYVAPHF